MSSKSLIALIVIILIAAGVYLFMSTRASAPAPENTQESVTEGAAGTVLTQDEAPNTVVVTYSDAGFAPGTVTIKKGQTVRFVNQSGGTMWVGADEHPTHTTYDGTSTREHCADGVATTDTFDQCHAAPVGETYEYTFTKTGSWSYHNHTRAQHGGTVVVTE